MKHLQKINSTFFENIAEKAAYFFLFLYAAFFFSLDFLRYQYFYFFDMDFAIYSQVMWNMLHGSFFSSILGVSFLENHTDIILFHRFFVPL